MENKLQTENKDKVLYGVKGWLIVFAVFLPHNLLLTIIQGFTFEIAIFLALITLVFTVLIMVFLFKKKMVFRLLFIILMGIDLGFCLAHFFTQNAIAELSYYPAPIVFLLICLAKLLFFTIYLFKSKRVQNTYESKQGTFSGGTSAFAIFIISFMVLNIISLIETSTQTGSQTIRYNQIPFISNIMAYAVPIILGAFIIMYIIRRKSSLRAVFIVMMSINIALLFHVFSYFDNAYLSSYELNSFDLPMSVIAQCAYAFLSLIVWTVVVYKSKSIQSDFKIS